MKSGSRVQTGGLLPKVRSHRRSSGNMLPVDFTHLTDPRKKKGKEIHGSREDRPGRRQRIDNWILSLKIIWFGSGTG